MYMCVSGIGAGDRGSVHAARGVYEEFCGDAAVTAGAGAGGDHAGQWKSGNRCGDHGGIQSGAFPVCSGYIP